jgi:hypothetical protein
MQPHDEPPRDEQPGIKSRSNYWEVKKRAAKQTIPMPNQGLQGEQVSQPHSEALNDLLANQGQQADQGQQEPKPALKSRQRFVRAQAAQNLQADREAEQANAPQANRPPAHSITVQQRGGSPKAAGKKERPGEGGRCRQQPRRGV